MKYASSTTVSPEKSRGEIEAMLTRYGANSFGYAWEEQGRIAVIQFCAKDRLEQRRRAPQEPIPISRKMTSKEFRAYINKRDAELSAADAAPDHR